jgi:lysophospholipase L1-like esterase
VIGLLFLFSWLPRFSIGAWTFRKIDPLADIRTAKDAPTDKPLISLDSIKTESSQRNMDSATLVAKTGCPPGVTCIENYSPDGVPLKYFIQALNEMHQKHKAVRVAFYGDSFVEGDVFCGSLRDTLQQVFGGEGVGYVPITSEVAGFRATIRHKFEHWKTYSLLNKIDTSISARPGPSGFSFLPQEGNWVEYKPARRRFLRDFNTVKLYYKNTGHAVVDYTVNDTVSLSENLKTSGRMQEWTHRGKKMSAIRFQFQQSDSLEMYGASFENGEGIYVDNFSVRGNSGINLARIPDETLTEFNRHRNYKLIVLQYGLNSVLEDSLSYGWYVERMINVVNKLKRLFPKTSILLMSVSDRSSNTSGEFKTMKAIPAMRDAQRLIAERTGIAFWDLFEAMGGENSMVKMAEGKPPMAAKDYTHLNFRGGEKLSGRMAKSLLHEQKSYNEKVAQAQKAKQKRKSKPKQLTKPKQKLRKT